MISIDPAGGGPLRAEGGIKSYKRLCNDYYDGMSRGRKQMGKTGTGRSENRFSPSLFVALPSSACARAVRRCVIINIDVVPDERGGHGTRDAACFARIKTQRARVRVMRVPRPPESPLPHPPRRWSPASRFIKILRSVRSASTRIRVRGNGRARHV